MIYLDYAATSPINKEVLDSYNKVCTEFIGNPHSFHKLGIMSKELINSATKQIAELLNVNSEEIIYTSGSTEANNIAVINTCLANEKLGKHIITSKMEHPSMYNIFDYLKEKGYKIDYVNNKENGVIDFDDLKKLIKKDTILVSICGINSETGVRQPLKLIRQIIKKANTNTFLHSDITQGIGKVNINFSDLDLATFTAHKFAGPQGIGVLYKKSKVKMNPFVIGSGTEIIGGTPPTPLVVALSKALRIALKDLNKKEEIVQKFHDKICNVLLKYEDVIFNHSDFSIPHIINISIPEIKPETFVHALEEKEIYISSNTACSNGKISTAVYAMTGDKKRASTTLRISLSDQTTNVEVNSFLFYFDEVYNKLKNLGEK